MDKKSKEALRRYKKSRQAQSSSESSSSSDSDSGSSSSYSSSDSERRHRHKKARPSGSQRRSTSSSDERHKREKRDHCQKKLEAKRNHLKRKLKEAKLKKKAAAAAAALSGHSHRALSPATQAKLKKLAERKHLRAASKERREREKEKHRAALREREREHHRIGSRSPTKITKIRIHQDVKRQKSPPRMHHQLMSREKIIIQTRTRDRTPSAERERRHEHKFRHDDVSRERDRREREAARDKERAEALARCQERQRERERLAREKLRREEEEKYGKAPGSDRLLPRAAERVIPAVRGYESRERSMERAKRDVDSYEHGYVRKHRGENEFDEESDRRGHLDREELLREREYLTRRRELSPGEFAGPTGSRMRGDLRDLYPEEERDRPYKRPYLDEGASRVHATNREAWVAERELRERDMHDHPRDYRGVEAERMYADERERLPPREGRERPPFVGRPGTEWKRNDWGSPRERTEWQGDEGGQTNSGRSIGFVGGPKRGGGVGVVNKVPQLIQQREQREPSEPDWDAEEGQIDTPKKSEGTPKRDWIEHDQRETTLNREKIVPAGRPWNPNEWREGEEGIIPSSGYPRVAGPMIHHPRSDRGGRGGYRGRGVHIDHGERIPGHGFRPHHPPALMNLPVPPPGYHGIGAMPRFPNKRNMTYTNPNILKKQQAALAAAKAAAQASAVAAATTAVAAAKAAAQSAANATTNPSILGQVSINRQQANDEKPEAGEIVGENEQKEEAGIEVISEQKEKKNSGELSEISDSDDDILNKTEKKAKTESEEYNSQDKQENDDKGDDEEIMDFEEISDGELEEERAARGVGDALGVDWSSLVAETKRVPSNQTTTAKQKWQPHRIILDVGISMRMASEEYAKRLLCQAKQQLDEELKAENEVKMEAKVDIKSEIKEENSSLSNLDEDSQATALGNDENTSDFKPKEEVIKDDMKPVTEDIASETFNVDLLPPLACMQVSQQKLQMERRQLITNACGINSRALSARQDLKLRRQLCGLPARECELTRNIPQTSEKLKAMALAAFQRTLQVK